MVSCSERNTMSRTALKQFQRRGGGVLKPWKEVSILTPSKSTTPDPEHARETNQLHDYDPFHVRAGYYPPPGLKPCTYIPSLPPFFLCSCPLRPFQGYMD